MAKGNRPTTGSKGNSSSSPTNSNPAYALNEELTGGEFYNYGSNEDAGEWAMGYGNGGEADRWAKRLTSKEVEAIESYTDTGYGDINTLLRYPDWDDDLNSYKTKKAALADAKRIDKAIEKFDLKEKSIFHRGDDGEILNGATSVEDVRKMIGKVVTDKGFVSTSTKNEGLVHMDYSSVLYHIQTPKGKGIGAYIKEYGLNNENEFLFHSGSQFMITGAYKKNGKLNVNMLYVGIEN